MKYHPYPTRRPVTASRALRGALSAQLGPLGAVAWVLCMFALALIFAAYWLAVPLQRGMASEFSTGRRLLAVSLIIALAVGGFTLLTLSGGAR